MAFNYQAIKTNYKAEVLDDIKVSVNIKRFLFKNNESKDGNGAYIALVSVVDKKPVASCVDGVNRELTEFVIKGDSERVLTEFIQGQNVDISGNFQKGRKNDEVVFVVKSMVEIMPDNLQDLAIFLGSGKLKGVGPSIARAIVAEFKDNTINILNNDDGKSDVEFLKIRGISTKKANELLASWVEWRDKYKVLIDLKEFDVSDSVALKIYGKYGVNSIKVIRDNPYLMAYISGIGFKTADAIANKLNIDKESHNRISSCFEYVLEQLSGSGDTVVELEVFLQNCQDLLEINRDLIENVLVNSIRSGDIIYKEMKRKVGGTYKEPNLISVMGVASRKLHEQEVGIAMNVTRILNFCVKVNANKNYEEFVRRNDSGLSTSQLEAQSIVCNNKVSILTGGPGTGKTHLTKSIVAFYKALGLNVRLCAPTGKAAKRMREVIGEHSETIHRLLKFEGNGFAYNENNLLEGDVFIIDESSMIDVGLGYALLSAIPSSAIVVFVGDKDQLRPVQAGAVFRDLVESEVVPSAKLTEIRRTSENSHIAVSARDIINQKMPVLDNIDSKSDCVIVEKDGEEVLDEIETIVKDLLACGVKECDIQLLAATKEKNCGVNALNERLRPILNKKYTDWDVETKFIIGDKVMQFENDVEKKIFNGDVGVIQKLPDAMSDKYLIDFDGVVVEFGSKELSSLDYAYATTIHKSQGSDYPVVIIPLVYEQSRMFDCNLLYTGLTRGKNRVIFVGSKRVLANALSERNQRYCATGLQNQLESYIGNNRNIVNVEEYYHWMEEVFNPVLEVDKSSVLKFKN